MSKYKKGDKVRVISMQKLEKIAIGDTYRDVYKVPSGNCMLKGMLKLCGKTVVISRASMGTYSVLNSPKVWTDDMFTRKILNININIKRIYGEF